MIDLIRLKSKLLFLLIFLSVSLLYSESDGIRLFKLNKTLEAITVFEKDLQSENADPSLYNYLGLSYFQVGNYQKAIDVFTKGINSSNTNKKILYYNMANCFFVMQNYSKAEENYSMAIIADSTYTDAILNRANTRLKLDKIDDSCSDYNLFISLLPNDKQAESIKHLLSLLSEEKNRREQEELRIAEENEKRRIENEKLAAAKEEQEKLEAEKKEAEALRRKKLLEDVANSLQQSSDTRQMSAGAENVLKYNEESDID